MRHIEQCLEPILLLGGSGMLGRAWRRQLESQGLSYDAPSRTTCDLRKPASLRSAVTGRYRTVINCAGWTDVDGAETNPDEACAVNAAGVGALADCCGRTGATLLHYSTDYVFDGRAHAPYATDRRRAPINAYGRSKAMGEEAIERSGCDHLIVRTSWLYADWGSNFVLTMRRLMCDRSTLRVVDDQQGTPTSAVHLAATSMALAQAGVRGLAHVTDGGECTWRQFAEHIGMLLGSPCTIEPCTSDEFPRPARRPAYSVLDISGTEAVVGRMPSWQTNLARTLCYREAVYS